MSTAPSIGWSDFARERYRPGGGHSYFAGGQEELLDLVRANWEKRRPGAGRDNLDEVVIVPLPPDRFVCSTVLIDETTPLSARFVRRRPEESGYGEITAHGPREEAREAGVVLYHAAVLEQNGGRRSGEAEWEIVCVIAAASSREPMDPLTMARNMLAETGGTPCRYSAEDFAQAVWYWSLRARIDPDRS